MTRKYGLIMRPRDGVRKLPYVHQTPITEVQCFNRQQHTALNPAAMCEGKVHFTNLQRGRLIRSRRRR